MARLFIIVLAATLLGCAGHSTTPSPDQGAAVRPDRVKTLTLATDAEPALVVTSMGARSFDALRNAVHQHLAAYDNRGEVFPQLATEIPSRAAGTWVVRPDGTMQTTYKIRPNVTWHDGVPLTADDFVFGWKVTTDDALPIESKAASSEIARIDTPDDHTLVIEWKRLYVQAYAISEDDLGPFPAHLLRAAYDNDRQKMWNSPYWTTGFVGVGPYKLAEWVPGDHIQLEAYDVFFGGRAKIDQIVIRIIPSQEAILANLRAGTVDKSVSKGGAKIQQQLALKNEWEQVGKKPTVFLSSSTFQHVWIQFRAPVFPELTDVRVRRGLLYALDRPALAEALTAGLAPPADSFMPTDDVRWDWMKDTITRYPYDPRQAAALFASAGLQRGADGILVNPAGTRMVLPHWTTPGTDHEQQLAIEGDQWRAVGVQTEQVILSPTQANDVRSRSAFPALNNAGWPSPTIASIEARLTSAKCPTAQNDFNGQNYGCYMNPAWDQVIGQIKTALDPADQRAPYAELARLYSEALPLLPLYFDVSMEVFREGITGVKGVAKPDGSITWNIAEWDIAS